ncbi:MAG: PaaI family thioesterase [Actinomycetota bacterium]|nr:PaaI family thioesterase [Actinomycetota bacterium]
MSRSELVYENTIHERLGVRQVEASPDRVIMELDIGPHVHQPMGILHGGASAVLAESSASIGAYLNCSPSQYAVGIDLNISHLRTKTEGLLRATATPIRKGRSIHVWNVDLSDEGDRLVAKARLTLLIKPWDSNGASKGA